MGERREGRGGKEERRGEGGGEKGRRGRREGEGGEVGGGKRSKRQGLHSKGWLSSPCPQWYKGLAIIPRSRSKLAVLVRSSRLFLFSVSSTSKLVSDMVRFRGTGTGWLWERGLGAGEGGFPLMVEGLGAVEGRGKGIGEPAPGVECSEYGLGGIGGELLALGRVGVTGVT